MTSRPRRSVLYVPASSEKALAKLPGLACDAVIIDLEDAVAPGEKVAARRRLEAVFADRPASGPELVIRVNALAGEWGLDDLRAARECRPDAILIPKVDSPRDILDADEELDRLEANPDMQLWAMVETPRAMLNIGAIAELGRDRAARLACLVAGTNDLAKDTRVKVTPDRRWLTGWLQHIVLAARAAGIDALDGVMNEFRDLDAFAAECTQGADMGFDGKTLIHPAQIAPANTAFSPSKAEIAEAETILAAFARPEHAARGVIALDGRMVERLHLEQAQRLLAKAGR